MDDTTMDHWKIFFRPIRSVSTPTPAMMRPDMPKEMASTHPIVDRLTPKSSRRAGSANPNRAWSMFARVSPMRQTKNALSGYPRISGGSHRVHNDAAAASLEEESMRMGG